MDGMVERLHLPFCNYIQMFPWNTGVEDTRRKVAWMPRGHYKSSVCSIALPLWFLIHNRNATIALISAKIDNPKKWMRQIKTILTKNKFLRFAFPEIRPGEKWDELEIVVTRDPSLSGEAQASITASSITSGQASQHYDHIILDDAVNEKTIQSESLTQTAVELYDYLDALLNDWHTSTFTVVGTPYGRGDVMEHIMETEVKMGERLYWGIGARGEFQCSEELKEHPQLIPMQFGDYPGGPWREGLPIFPEVCPEALLKKIQEQNVVVYHLQYLCKPYDPARAGFHLKLIRDFIVTEDESLKCDCHSKHDHHISNAVPILLCDPAASESKRACRSAIVVAAQAPCGCRFLLDEWADRVTTDKTIDKLVEMSQKWQPWLTHVGIEDVGFQILLKAWLLQLQNENKYPKQIVFHPLKPDQRNKNARIASQVTPVKNGLWHKRPYMMLSDADKNFMWELSRWPHGKERDLIDAGFGYCEDIWQSEDVALIASREEDPIDYNAVEEAHRLPSLFRNEV